MLRKLAKAGMNIARLNMSHGSHDSHAEVIESIRKLNITSEQPIAVMLDTQGPEIRTGDRTNDLHLKTGDVISIVVRCSEDVESTSILVNYEDLVKDMNSCLLYTSPSPRDLSTSRMPSSA